MKDLLQQIEGALLRIKSVLGARVVADAQGEISEVHVLATEERNPKQVVRDVESTLLVKFNKRVDHKKIGVVQQAASGLSIKDSRLKIQAIRTLISSEGDAIEVVLQGPGTEEYSGKRLTTSSRGKLSSASAATLAAVNSFLGEERFLPQSIHRLSSLDQPAVLATVIWQAARGPQVLLGGCLVKESEEEAAVKATLSALNRVLGLEKSKKI